MVLLIVINHEKPENKQPREKTANNLAREPEIPESPCDGSHQKKSSGKDIRPTPYRVIHRIRFSCQYNFFSCSQCSLPVLHPEGRRALCQKSFSWRRQDRGDMSTISRPLRRRYRLPYGGFARGSATASNPTWYSISQFSLSVISSPYSDQYVLSFLALVVVLPLLGSRMQQVTKIGRD